MLMKSPDEESFSNRVSKFEEKYVPTHIEEVRYIKTNWLDIYKEKLVKGWVDQHPHFDNVVTSRVEGIHALLKSHLKQSTLDLFEAWRAIKRALLNQLAELRSNQAKQQIRTPIELSGSLYNAVRGWVSHEALRKVEKQRKLLLKTNPPPPPQCTGAFSRSQGLPCVHKLEKLLSQDRVLQLEDFHPHWHLNRNGTPKLLLEPRRRIETIAAVSTLPQSSVRRELSGFEVVETTVPPKTPPICSKCHAIGHARNSRMCPLRYAELRQRPPTELEQPPLQSCATSSHGQERLITASEQLELKIVAEVQRHHSMTQSQGSSVTTTKQVCRSATPSIEPLRQVSTGAMARLPTPDARTPSPEPTPTPILPSPPLVYHDPRAIYQRYVEARDAWYKAQIPGTYVNNQKYRRAKGLPLGYKKASYTWCLDYKQMGKQCVTSKGARDWTREEMMAYLDWDKSENDRIDAQVALELESSGSKRRGMGQIWRRAEQDHEEQQALYSKMGDKQSHGGQRVDEDTEEDCIYVLA